MVKVTEFEELCNAVVENWNISVGSVRVVQSRLASIGLTCIQSHVCGSGGDFHPDCLGLEQLTWPALLCVSFILFCDKQLSHPYPHGNGQSARQQTETCKGSWNLDLEMVPCYFHLILLAKVTWLNSKSKDWSIDLISHERPWQTYIAKSMSTRKDRRQLETQCNLLLHFSLENLWDTFCARPWGHRNKREINSTLEMLTVWETFRVNKRLLLYLCWLGTSTSF